MQMTPGTTGKTVDQRCLEIGQRIRQARRHRDLTQDQLAELLGISRITMNRVERGRAELTMTQIDRLARELHYSPGYFFAQQSMASTA
jgi:transcriptional regulator with XRE-family HTH domain